MNTENYSRSLEIEFFIKSHLSAKEKLKADYELHNLYQGIVWYEEGESMATPSMHKNNLKKLTKYFGLVINKLSKKNDLIAFKKNVWKSRMEDMSSSRGFLLIYNEISSLLG